MWQHVRTRRQGCSTIKSFISYGVQSASVSSQLITKTMSLQFQPTAQDTCSVCLKPVYPMERMVTDKFIFHKNCFCCKHCRKKLRWEYVTNLRVTGDACMLNHPFKHNKLQWHFLHVKFPWKDSDSKMKETFF